MTNGKIDHKSALYSNNQAVETRFIDEVKSDGEACNQKNDDEWLEDFINSHEEGKE